MASRLRRTPGRTGGSPLTHPLLWEHRASPRGHLSFVKGTHPCSSQKPASRVLFWGDSTLRKQTKAKARNQQKGRHHSTTEECQEGIFRLGEIVTLLHRQDQTPRLGKATRTRTERPAAALPSHARQQHPASPTRPNLWQSGESKAKKAARQRPGPSDHPACPHAPPCLGSDLVQTRRYPWHRGQERHKQLG